MIKIWTNYDGGDKIVAYVDGKIYKANPPQDEIESTVSNMQMNDFSGKKTFGIPLHNLRGVRLQEGKEYIQVFFGAESEEHFIIKNKELREEIFNYLKANIPGTVYQRIKYTPAKAAKKPLIAMVVVGVIFTYTLFLALTLEAGVEYEYKGTRGSTGGILLGIAGFGVVKVILIFGGLLGIAGLSAFFKMRNPPEFQIVLVTRS